MRRPLVIGYALLLASCGGASESAREQQDPDAAPTDGAASLPAAPAFAWTGDWAATEELCRDGRWHMAHDRIVTAGETSCAVEGEKADVNGAVTLDLACTAEGAASPERWILEPLADGRMTVTRASGGNVMAKVALARCG